MAAQIELQENETILKEIKGDYWEGAIFSSQKTGTFYFTSQRIVFRGGFIAALDLPYSEIDELTTCNVGPLVKFMPTGILVKMKDGKKYRLSVLKRKELMALVQSNMK